jgi:dTMP kinase
VLIVFDGVYSAGKSTLIDHVVQQLRGHGCAVATTEWNSSDIVGDLIPTWKREGRLGGHSLLFAEAADLAHRCEKSIWPSLDDGRLVVADRYVLSGMARSVIRGVDADLAASVFSFAPKETLTVLVECPAEVTLARRQRLGKHLGGYHSGRDYRRSASVEADFVRYQDEMHHMYRGLAAGRGAVMTVSTLSPLAECTDAVMAALAVRMGHQDRSADASLPW